MIDRLGPEGIIRFTFPVGKFRQTYASDYMKRKIKKDRKAAEEALVEWKRKVQAGEEDAESQMDLDEEMGKPQSSDVDMEDV
jgi:hypothetical protein